MRRRSPATAALKRETQTKFPVQPTNKYTPTGRAGKSPC
jgi:hypothetical protein